jgi:hypothetical protein
VYTYAGHHDQVADLADTWGWRCDGFFAASTRTDRSIGAVDLPHKGKERYDNMWQKTRSMVAFMYDHYLDDYDYFLLCGDDTYVIVENLRNYLMLLEATTGGRESAQPLYIGAPIHFHGVNYNTGGSAYLLNTVALRRLVELALPHYFPQTACSAEDVFMGIIMSALSIPLVDTSDAHHRQRFFHDNFTSVGSDQGIDMYGHYVYKHHHDDNHRRTGRDLVSTQSVGFHRVTSMKRFHAILYKTCPSGTVLGDAMLQIAIYCRRLNFSPAPASSIPQGRSQPGVQSRQEAYKRCCSRAATSLSADLHQTRILSRFNHSMVIMDLCTVPLLHALQI